jgi:dTMP kinase
LPPGHPDRSGALIVFEGLDGSGKSTQARTLAEKLRGLGLTVRLSQEPTDGEHGRALRELWATGGRHDARDELELFRLDRREHVDRLIEPGLRAGDVVILDRYYYSSEAYQGVRGLMSPQAIHTMMTAIAPTPDMMVLLDITPEVSLKRITDSRADTPNALEQFENLVKVRQAFDKMSYPEIRRFDASLDPDTLAGEVFAAVKPVLRSLGMLDH